MPLPSIQGPRLFPRDGMPPMFIVDEEPGRSCVIQVATSASAMRSADSALCWGSWEQGLSSPGSFSLPDSAWRRFRASPRLFYRAHSSTRANAWTDHRTSTPDGQLAQCPSVRLCDAWIIADLPEAPASLPGILAAAARHPQFNTLASGDGLSALACLHRFSPKRPVAPSSLEWSVVLASERQAGVDMLVQRLAFADLGLIHSRFSTAPGSLLAAAEIVPGVSLVETDTSDVALWPRSTAGPFLVFQDSAPSPTDPGGTCIVLPGPGVIAYRAQTLWSPLP